VPPNSDAEVRQIIARFLNTIPAMIAAAPIIAAALSIDLAAHPRIQHEDAQVPAERAN